MNNFNMCPDCEAEYSMPSDRRFLAQPDACHTCGPSVSLYNNEGELLAIGKMGSPMKKRQDVDVTVDVRLDFE